MKTIAPLFPIILFCLLTGCIRPDFPETEAATRVFNINYSFDAPKTRAASTVAERELKDVAVLFYKADDRNPDNETYVACQAIDMPQGSTSSGSFPLQLPEGIKQGEKYKLIIIGNYDKYAPEGKSLADYAGQYATRTYNKMRKEIYGQLVPVDERVTTPLPFRGTLLDKNGYETTLTGPAPGTTSLGVSVKFSRAVARIDVVNLAADKLKIAWAKVCNYRNKGYFYNEYFLAGGIVRGAAAAPPTAGEPYPAGYVTAGEPDDSEGHLRQNLTSGGLYTFANTTEHPLQDDALSTCLLIAGYYKASGTADYSSELTYYRANVNESGNSQVLRPNYIYTLLINNVKKEGQKTEEDALAGKEKPLEYLVDDDWDSESVGTVTDDAGNFLTVSRTSVSVGSKANDAAVVQVLVKPGTGYTVGWNKPEDENLFHLADVQGDRFSIVANSENETREGRTAKAVVRLTGGSAPLFINIDVLQLAAINDPTRLKVDGNVKDFEYTVPGEGANVSLQVLVGDPDVGWTATADAELQAFMGTSTLAGANEESIQIEFPVNGTGKERRGTLTVVRNPDDGEQPITVSFVQPSKPMLTIETPDYTGDTFTVEGFSSSTGISSNQGADVTKVRFNVTLADPLKYTYTIESSFDYWSEAFLATNTYAAASVAWYSPQKPINKIANQTNNQTLYLRVWRTGPGDADIKGTVTVTATPNPGTDGLEYRKTYHITIHTSCDIGECTIGNLIVADRNLGAEGAGSYVNIPYHPDIENINYRGTFYDLISLDGGLDPCQNYVGKPSDGRQQWRLPSYNELNTIMPQVILSKCRYFVLSKTMAPDGNFVGAYLPTDERQYGSKGELSRVQGRLFGTPKDANRGGWMSIDATPAGWIGTPLEPSHWKYKSPYMSHYNHPATNKKNMLVRCVRDK